MIKRIYLLILTLIFVNLLFAWTWPLNNSSSPDTYISAFGPRDKEETQGLQYDFHRGMDLRTPATGPPQSEIDIYAAHDGTVET